MRTSHRERFDDGLVEVGDKVFDVLDTHGEAQQPVGESGLGALGGRDGGVRHRRRVPDERFDAAQALGQRENLGGRGHAPRAIEAAFELEGDHPARHAHLRPGEVVVAVRGQARVMHQRHLGMLD